MDGSTMAYANAYAFIDSTEGYCIADTYYYVAPMEDNTDWDMEEDTNEEMMEESAIVGQMLTASALLVSMAISA
jgi:hypothetical protein